jgi:hypothetical protein
MFIKVVSTVITQEIEPQVPYKVEPGKLNNETNVSDTRPSRELLSRTEQSEYDVLYGKSLC